VSFADRDRLRRERELLRRRRARWLALGGLASLIFGVLAAVVLATGGGGSAASTSNTGLGGTGIGSSTARSTTSTTTSTTSAGRVAVPILVYHVINNAPASTNSPQLYVPVSEFTAQMQALKSAGWHAVTLDQIEASWAHGKALGTTKPIVLTFDVGYASVYNNALPALRQLGWVGVLNYESGGLAVSDGGLADAQVRGLVSAGWELDSEGVNAADLTTLSSSELQTQVAGARQTLQSSYGVHANWYAYPGGSYNSTVIAALKSAGFTGGLTTVAGWASSRESTYALPRLVVAPGTTPAALLSQIAAARNAAAPPTT
jgi:peptidoglycan/xylan/chitin deacetylase (PgdA/CDA1 family)